MDIEKEVFMKALSLWFIMIFVGSALAAQAAPDWLSAWSAGGTSDDRATAISTTAFLLWQPPLRVVSGYFTGTTTIGSTTLTSSGNSDIYVAKMGTSGSWLWAVKAGSIYADCGLDNCNSGDGGFIVTGYFTGSVAFGTTTLVGSGAEDIFVAKIDTDGNWVWAKRAGGSARDCAYSVCVDSDNNVYLTGDFQGTASFGAYSLTSGGSYDVCVAKLDGDGNWLWASKASGTGDDTASDISTDSGDNVYVTGSFHTSTTFGSTVLSGTGYDIFIAKLNSGGSWLWAKRAGGSGNDKSTSIDTDTAGNSYVTGIFYGTADFGSTNLTSAGQSDVFVAKLNTSGTWTFAKKGGGTSYDYASDIAITNTGDSYIIGSFYGSAQFGDDIVTASGSYYDVLMAKMDVSGNWLWAQKAGGTGTDMGLGLSLYTALNGTVTVWTTGVFETTANFSAISLTSQGNYDFFIAKIDNPNTSASIPKAPQNVHIQPIVVDETFQNPLVTWNAVGQDTWGRPVTVHHYNIYHSFPPYGTFSLIGQVSGTSANVWCDEDLHGFIYVTAVVQ
jgi:hypothetical protein